MNFKGTLRRTLAMLLVLIFALSNMGLAEMAEQIAESIPAEEPQIEEVAAEEAAPVEEQEAEEEAAPAEDEATEPAEEPVPTVQVVAYQIDEHSFFADAEGTVYDGELAYQWEIADGEDWVAIEGATDAVYSADVDALLGNSFRAIVTAGVTAVASDPVAYDAEAYGVAPMAVEEPVELEESVELAAVNVAPTQKPVFSITQATKSLIVDGKSTDALDVTVSSAQESGQEVLWVLHGDAAKYFMIGDSKQITKKETLSGTQITAIQIKVNPDAISKAGDDPKLTVNNPSKVEIICYVANSGTEMSSYETANAAVTAENAVRNEETIEFSALPALTKDDFTITYERTDECEGNVFWQTTTDQKGKDLATFKAVANDGTELAAPYIVKWEAADVAGTAAEEASADISFDNANANGAKMTIAQLTASNKFTATEKTANIKCTITNGTSGASDSNTQPIKIQALANKLEIRDEQGKAFASPTKITAGGTLKVSVVPSLDDGDGTLHDKDQGITLYGGDTYTWENAQVNAQGSTATVGSDEKDTKLATLKVTANQSGKLTVTAKSNLVDTLTGALTTEIDVEKLPEANSVTIEPDKTEITLIRGDETKKTHSLQVKIGGQNTVTTGTSAVGLKLVAVDAEQKTRATQWLALTPALETDLSTLQQNPLKATIGISDTSSGNTSTDGGPVKLKLVYPYWDTATSKPATGEIPINVHVVDSVKNLTLSSTDIQLDRESITMPRTDESGYEWAKTKAWLNPEKVDSGFPVTWSFTVKESNGVTTHDDFLNGVTNNDRSYTLEALAAKYANANAVEELANGTGLTVTITAEITDIPDATVSREIPLYIAPDSITLAPLEQQEDGTMAAGTPYALGQTNNVQGGGTIQLQATALVGGVKPADGKGNKVTRVDFDWQPAAGETDDGHIDEITVNADGSLDWTPSTNCYGTYVVKMYSKDTDFVYPDPDGGQKFTLNVQKAPDHVTAKEENGRETVSLKSNGDTDAGKLNIVAVATNKDSDKNVYTKDIKWTLEPGITGKALDAKYISATVPASPEPDPTFWLVPNTADPSKVELHWSKLTSTLIASDFEGRTITITPSVENSGAGKTPLTLTLKTTLDDTNLTGWDTNLGFSNKEKHTTTNAYIKLAQGQSMTIETNFPEEKVLALGDNKSIKDALEGYKIEVAFANDTTGGNIANASDANLEDWFEFNADDMTITAKEPDTTSKKNILTNAKQHARFTAKVSIPDVKDHDDENGACISKTLYFEIVSKPTAVKFALSNEQPYKHGYSANSLDTSTQDVDGDPTSGNELPISLHSLDKINVYAYAVCIDEDDNILETTEKVDSLNISGGATATVATPDTFDVNNGCHWTITNDGTNGTTALITASASGANGSAEIRLVDETAIIFVDGGKTPSDCAKASGEDKHHVWRAVTDGMKGQFTPFADDGEKPNLTSKIPDASGHYYVCVVCGKVSDKLRGHGYKQWSAINLDKHADGTLYTEDEIKWKNPADKHGDIVCDACGFECTHGDKLTPAIYENSNYHVGTCPICGLDIKEAHVDTNPKDGTCDVCGDAAASPKFADGDLTVMVVGGEKYTPNLTVKDTKEFTVAYSAAGWEDYIDVAADGTVTAKKVTDPANPAILTAEVTSGSKTTSGSKATATKKIAVKERIAAINLVSDHHNVGDETKAYTVFGAEPIKITATFPGTTNPDWSGYTWKADSTDLEFVYKDKKGEWQAYDNKQDVFLADKADTDVCAPIVSGGVTTVEIYARVSDSYNRSSAANESIAVTLEPTKDQKNADGKVLDPVKGEIKVEVLHLLSGANIEAAGDGYEVAALSDKLYLGTSAGTLGKYQIVQGDSIVASLMEDAKTPFDSRYGQVSYKLLGDTTGDTKNWGAADIRNWAEVTGSNTITTKASDSSTNVLSASRPSVTLTLRAIITLETMDDRVTPAKPAKVYFDRKIQIMPAPKAVTIKYFDPTSTEETEAKKWKAVDGPITVTEGDELLLTVEVEQDALDTIGEKDVAFEWPTAEFDNTEYKWESTGTGSVNGYKLRVKQGASSTISIPVICYGVSIAPIEINVQRQATNITVTSDTAAVGAGERVKNANGSKGPKQITLTANLLPEGAKDNLTWRAYYTTDGVKKNGEILQISNLLKNAQGQDKTKTSLTIDVPTAVQDVSAAKGYGVLVEVEAEKAKDENGKARIGSTWFTIHPAPTSNAGLLLELAKPISGSMYVMTVGETTEITKHGYDTEKNYGWSGSPDIEVTSKTTKLNNTAEGAPTEVLSVETREDGKVYVTGTAEGTATLSITSYETLAGSVTKTITVRVAPKVDEVRFDTENLKNPDEITVDGTPKLIAASLLTAYRKSGASDSVTDCYDAMVLLKAKPDGVVEITKNGINWEVKGKKAGTVEIYAAVGEGANEVRSENSITLNVKNTPTGIRFYQNDVEVGPQILQVKGKTEKITLVAKTYPEDSFGAVEILKPTGTAVEYNLTNNSTTIDLTPDAVGITTITAQVKNPAFSGIAAPNSPEFLQGQIEVVVTEEETGSGTVTPDVPTSVQIVGKKAIGPGEKTDVVAPGIEDADAAGIVWEITEGASRAKIEGNGARIKVVGGESAGLATVTATLNGKSVGEAQVNILTAIEGISFNNKTDKYALNKGERVKLEPEFEGYESVVEGGAERDTSDLVAYTMANAADAAYVTLDYDAEGNAYIVGVKQNTKNKTTKNQAYIINAKAFGGKTKQIAVTMESNKTNTGFSIPQNGAVLSMAEGDSLTVIPTWEPAKTTAVLKWKIDPEDEGLKLSGNDDAKIIEVVEGASESYTVTVTEAGYPDRPAQSFTINVVGAADESATIAYQKVGVSSEPQAASNLTLSVGEKIQLMLMDADKANVAGVTWTTSNAKIATVDNAGVVSVLKANTKGVDITSSKGQKLHIKSIAAPAASKFKFSAPAVVGVGEKFPVEYTAAGYKGTGVNLKDIVSSNSELGLTVDEETGLYSFSEAGTTILTGNTTYGKTPKTATVLVKPELGVDELVISGPAKIAKGQNVHLSVALGDAEDEEAGYANIAWTVGGNAVTSMTKAVKTGVSGITAKLVSNNEIVITATAKAKTGPIAVTAKATGYDLEAEAFTLTADNADAALAEGTLVFEKPVIAVGETTYAKIVNEDGEELGGNIKLSVDKASKKLLTVSGNKVTAKKEGTVTVTATAGGANKTATIYIASAPGVVMNNKPTKIAAGSEAHVALKISGYMITSLPEDITANTADILTVSSNNAGLVDATITANEDIEPAEDGIIRDYTLKLKAADKVQTTKNKYPSATVTVNLFGKKFQSMKIQVVGETNASELRFPKEIWIEPGKTMALTPSAGDTNKAGVIDWQFVEGKQAAGMSFTKDGKLTVAKGTAAGGVSELIGIAGDATFKLTAHIGQKVKSKSNFSIAVPKTTIGVGEKMLMGVKFTSPYGGVVTWTSSKPAIASIDKVTGLLVGKQDSNGKTVTIKAKVNGKTQSTKIMVGGNPTAIAFDSSEYIAKTPSEEITVKATMTGGTNVSAGFEESAYTITIADNTAGLINEDESDLNIGKVIISAAPTLGTTATLHVETYNGLTDECIIVYGKPEGSGSVTPPPADLTPASIELMLMGAPLTNGESMTLEEGDTLAPVAVVKNKSNINITKDVTVAWSSTDKNNCIQLDTATGALVAKSTTWSAETKKNGADEAITVTASVMAGETELKAEYKINITVVMSGDHFLLRTLQRADVETMIKSDKLDVMLELTDAAQSNGPMGLTNATLKALTNNIIVTSKASNRWELNAVAVGTAELELSAKVDGKDYSVKKTIQINDLPTSNDITFAEGVNTANNTMIVGSEEPATFVVTLGEDFKGKLGDQVKASAYTLENGADGKPVPLTAVSVAEKTFAADEKAPDGKAFVLTCSETQRQATPKFRVIVQAYDENTKKEFTVEVRKGIANGNNDTTHDIEITTMPELTKEQLEKEIDRKISIGVGEKVTLTASTDRTWTSGLKWIITSNVPAADKDKIYVDNKDNGVAEFHYEKEINTAQTVTLKAVRGGMPSTDTALKGTGVTVTVCPKPTKANVGTGVSIKANFKNKDATNAVDTIKNIVLGVGERVDAFVNFGSQPCYTNTVFWDTDSTDVIRITRDANAPKAVIEGVNPTGSSTVELTAYAGTDNTGVKLATIQVQVKEAPNNDEIKIINGTNGNTEFTFTLSTTALRGGASVSLNLDATKVSGTYNLTTRDAVVQVEPITGKKNQWTIKDPNSKVTAGSIVTLTLSSEDGSFVKNYTLTVT